MRSVSGAIGNIASMALTGRSATPPAVDSIARMLAFVRANLEKTADQMRPIEAGWVVMTPSLPAVWVLNQVRVVLPLGFASLVDLADQQLAASRYVQITVENQAAGPGLERAFRDAGWKTDREVLMVLTATPDREAETSIVTDAGEQETVDVMKRWYGQDEPARAALDQLGEYSRREARACGDRLLGVRSSDGTLVAITKLRGRRQHCPGRGRLHRPRGARSWIRPGAGHPRGRARARRRPRSDLHHGRRRRLAQGAVRATRLSPPRPAVAVPPRLRPGRKRAHTPGRKQSLAGIADGLR